MRKVSLNKVEVGALAAALAEAALGLWIGSHAQGRVVALHYGLNGQPDSWGPGETLGPLIAIGAAGSVVTVAALGWAARRAEASDQRRRGLRLAQAVLTGVFAGLALMEAAVALGLGGERLPVLALAFIVSLLGAGLGRVPPNALLGLRTPWALSSRLAWDRSNRLAGRLFLGVGVMGLLLGLVEPSYAGLLLGGGIVLAAGLGALESWRVWRTDPERRLV